jgi:hypothetical protein
MMTNRLERGFNHAASNYGARHALRLRNPQALQKWVYVLAVLLVVAWTSVMWVVYTLLSLGDEALSAASRLLAIDPRMLDWLASVIGGTQQLGGASALIVWALGVAALLLASWLARRFIRAFSNPSTSGEAHAV